MTTQPSDWAVAQAFREYCASTDSVPLGAEDRVRGASTYNWRRLFEVAVRDRARELDASGGGNGVPPEVVGSFVEKAAQIISGAPFPSGRSLYKARQISDLALSMYATPRAAAAGDTELLDWLCTGERKMIEDTIDSGWFRVYRDVAEVVAEHAEWRAMTEDFYPTHREAIRAAMGAVGAGGGE